MSEPEKTELEKSKKQNFQLKQMAILDLVLSPLIYALFLLFFLKRSFGVSEIHSFLALLTYFLFINLIYWFIFKKVRKFWVFVLILISGYALAYFSLFVQYFSSGFVQNTSSILFYISLLFYPVFHLFVALKYWKSWPTV